MFRRLDKVLSKMLQEVPHFVKKHEESSIWPKFENFSRKLAWFRVMVNIWEESSKKCLISGEGTKNRRFGQNLELFRANYHDLAFGSTFRQKVAKTGWFRKRARKTVNLAKTCSFFEQTTSLWAKLQGFGANYHCSGFGSTFREKVGESS